MAKILGFIFICAGFIALMLLCYLIVEATDYCKAKWREKEKSKQVIKQMPTRFDKRI